MNRKIDIYDMKHSYGRALLASPFFIGTPIFDYEDNLLSAVLSLVKSIVELHGGSIGVESECGKGSKYTVVLSAKKVLKENMLLSNKLRNRKESVKVEFSDIYT